MRQRVGADLLRSLLTLRVIGDTLPIDYDAGLIANGPAVVAGRYGHYVSRPDFELGAVVHQDALTPGEHVAHVRRLTTVSARDVLDVLGPLPARLKRGEAEN